MFKGLLKLIGISGNTPRDAALNKVKEYDYVKDSIGKADISPHVVDEKFITLSAGEVEAIMRIALSRDINAGDKVYITNYCSNCSKNLLVGIVKIRVIVETKGVK